jgi:hypothetical protein
MARFERFVIFRILERTDHRLCGQAVADRIAAGAPLAFFSNWTSAFARVAPVGLDLATRSHGSCLYTNSSRSCRPTSLAARCVAFFYSIRINDQWRVIFRWLSLTEQSQI